MPQVIVECSQVFRSLTEWVNFGAFILWYGSHPEDHTWARTKRFRDTTCFFIPSTRLWGSDLANAPGLLRCRRVLENLGDLTDRSGTCSIACSTLHLSVPNNKRDLRSEGVRNWRGADDDRKQVASPSTSETPSFCSTGNLTTS